MRSTRSRCSGWRRVLATSISRRIGPHDERVVHGTACGTPPRVCPTSSRDGACDLGASRLDHLKRLGADRLRRADAEVPGLRDVLYCNRFLSPRHEHDHFPLPRRAGGIATVPACIDCHDLKDRYPNFAWPVYLLGSIFKGSEPLQCSFSSHSRAPCPSGIESVSRRTRYPCDSAPLWSGQGRNWWRASSLRARPRLGSTSLARSHCHGIGAMRYDPIGPPVRHCRGAGSRLSRQLR